MRQLQTFMLSIFCIKVILGISIQKNLTSASNRRLDNHHHYHHHHRMYDQFNASNLQPHKLAWMALEEVDGLKNTDVVMLLTSTASKNWFYFRSRYF